VKSEDLKILNVSEYLEEEYVSLEQVVEHLKSRSEIYPPSNMKVYFQTLNF